MQHHALLEQYFHAANAHDIENTLRYFATDAVVHDEGEEHHGTDAIRRWLESTNARYNTHYTIVNIAHEAGESSVVASVSGTFPGSPIQLTSRFVIKNGKITSLTCGA